MNNFTLEERARFYSENFPKFPPLRTDDRWLDGMWVLGNNYKGSGMYGAYPPTYLKRIMSLFPDAGNILHVFSGSLLAGKYVRFDIKKPADVVGDAEKLSEYLKNRKYDLILVDPPYSVEDALHYGKPMINRKKVLEQCYKVLDRHGYLVWLDQVLPMFRKSELHLCGLIGIVRSTNHRFRICCIWKKL